MKIYAMQQRYKKPKKTQKTQQAKTLKEW